VEGAGVTADFVGIGHDCTSKTTRLCRDAGPAAPLPWRYPVTIYKQHAYVPFLYLTPSEFAL